MGKISKALEGKGIDGCAFRKILLSLDEEDNDAVLKAVERGLSGYVIATALHDGGHKIAASTVAIHIAGRCKCT